MGVTDQMLYNWKAKYGGTEVSDAKRLRALEDENRRPKQLVQAHDIAHLLDRLRMWRQLESYRDVVVSQRRAKCG